MWSQTYISKVPIQDFYVAMNNLQCHEFIIIGADAGDEEKGSVSTVDNFGIYNEFTNVRISWASTEFTFVFQEVTHPCPPGKHQLGHVLDDLGFRLLRHGLEQFRKSDLA